MKKNSRKNQLIITALALMIVVAGYFSYTDRTAKDDAVAKEASEEVKETAQQVTDDGTYETGKTEIFTDEEDPALDAQNTEISGDTQEEATEETAAVAENASETEGATEEAVTETGTETAQADSETPNAGEAVLTGTKVSDVDYAANAKLSREQVRAQNKESLQKIIDNDSLDDAARQNAIDSMVKLTDIAEKENEAELLLGAKGFSDVVVSMSDDSVDVVLDMGEVTDAKRAQVEDIVKRKTGVAADKIVITPISVQKEEKTK
ncbi:MAG: SpoIIIAH-like family protein [Lachnospiraceae bacterium]